MRMHVGHVALRATDLEKSTRHAKYTLGLRETWRSDGEVHLTANAKHHELQLIQSPIAGIDHIGLEVEDARDVDAMRDRVVAAGARILSEGPQEPGIGAAMRCQGPEGLVFEIYAGMDRTPLDLGNAFPALARKLGHVTFYVEEKDELQRFVLDVLGFRVSDVVGSDVTWMRCDPDHHGIAIARSTRGGGSRMHHYAFEMASVGEIAHYADHIARDGQEFLWGPGRHGPGFNIFTYLHDPDEAVVEVYTDMIRIDDEAAYRAVDWAKQPRVMNLWGQNHPENWSELGIPILS